MFIVCLCVTLFSPLSLISFAQSVCYLCQFTIFRPLLIAGGPGSDLPLHGEAASDHRADGVLSGGHQGERPQWFPTGQIHMFYSKTLF